MFHRWWKQDGSIDLMFLSQLGVWTKNITNISEILFSTGVIAKSYHCCINLQVLVRSESVLTCARASRLSGARASRLSGARASLTLAVSAARADNI